jgi:seryl-tRNA synthetase
MSETMTGTGQLPKFEQDLFKTGVAERVLPAIRVEQTGAEGRVLAGHDDEHPRDVVQMP